MSATSGPLPLGYQGATPAKPTRPAEPDNYLTHDKGILSWIFTLDHKRIGVLYMIMVLSFFTLGGFFAVALRTMLWSPVDFAANPSGAKASYDLYNHFFTLHGAVMVFLFIIPAVPAILGNFVLPMMLGAKDVAFPRLNLLSLHIYILGAAFFTYVLISGVLHAAFDIHMPGGWGLDTGWTFY